MGKPETITYHARIPKRWDLIVGSFSLIFVALIIVLVFSGRGEWWMWLAFAMFGLGSVMFIRDLTAPKVYLELSPEGLRQGQGETIEIDLPWSQFGELIAPKKNQHITIRLLDKTGALMPLPEIDIPDQDDLYAESTVTLHRFGRDQVELGRQITAYHQAVVRAQA